MGFYFLTTTALFGHLTFYTSPKWEPQLKKRDPNHTEGRTMDNLCCPKMESTACRSLLGELQSLIWYWTHADKWTWSAVFQLESMHQKRWCPQYTSDLRKTALNCISAWGQHSHRSQTSALKVCSLPKCLREAHLTSELTTRCCLRAALPPLWDTRVSADLSGSP